MNKYMFKTIHKERVFNVAITEQSIVLASMITIHRDLALIIVNIACFSVLSSILFLLFVVISILMLNITNKSSNI